MKCLIDCKCGRHVSRRCQANCICPQHNKSGGQPKGCTPWNKGKKVSKTVAGLVAARNSPPGSSSRVKQRESLLEWFANLDEKTRKEIYGRERTPEVRKKISDALKGNQILSDTLVETRKRLPNKFRGNSRGKAGKREDLGFFVRSSWEANYARYLKLLKRQGLVVSFQYEPERFEFIDIKRGVRSYLPDFFVEWEDGRIEYHEVKGYWTSRGRTAVKRFTTRYPDKVLVIIDKDVYNKIKVDYSNQIPEWE